MNWIHSKNVLCIETPLHIPIKFTVKIQIQSNDNVSGIFRIFPTLLPPSQRSCANSAYFYMREKPWIMQILIGIPDANCNNANNSKTYQNFVTFCVDNVREFVRLAAVVVISSFTYFTLIRKWWWFLVSCFAL